MSKKKKKEDEQTKPWFIRLGFVDEDFKKRVEAEADRQDLYIGEYVTKLLEKDLGPMKRHGRKGFR